MPMPTSSKSNLKVFAAIDAGGYGRVDVKDLQWFLQAEPKLCSLTEEDLALVLDRRDDQKDGGKALLHSKENCFFPCIFPPSLRGHACMNAAPFPCQSPLCRPPRCWSSTSSGCARS